MSKGKIQKTLWLELKEPKKVEIKVGCGVSEPEQLKTQ